MSTETQPITSADAWSHWEEHCAVDLCPTSSADVLRKFGQWRFMTYLNRYASRTGHRGESFATPDIRGAWHRLETHAQVSATRAGKRYKAWLFERAKNETGAQWVSAMEAGASLLIRDVVREYLRREHKPHFMESLHRPLETGASVSASSYTLEELLPDTTDPLGPVMDRETDALAEQEAASFLTTMSRRESIVLWARGAGFPLADPDLLAWADCGKTAMHTSHSRCVARLCQSLKQAYPDETPAAWVLLARKTLATMQSALFLTLNAEKGGARFFEMKGIGMDEGARWHES